MTGLLSSTQPGTGTDSKKSGHMKQGSKRVAFADGLSRQKAGSGPESRDRLWGSSLCLSARAGMVRGTVVCTIDCS